MARLCEIVAAYGGRRDAIFMQARAQPSTPLSVKIKRLGIPSNIRWQKACLYVVVNFAEYDKLLCSSDSEHSKEQSSCDR